MTKFSQMYSGRYYKFRSTDAMESYMRRHDANKKFAKVIGMKPFLVTQTDGDGRAQTIRTSDGSLVNGNTFDYGGMVVISYPEFEFFYECEKPVKSEIQKVEVNPVDPIVGLSLKDAMTIYKLMYPTANVEKASVNQLIAAVVKYHNSLASIDEQIKKLQERRESMKI